MVDERFILKKRKFCYVGHPVKMYDIPGCNWCGGINVAYSEFVDFLWCLDCKKEYRPDYWGIFDGPIPMGLVKMMGVSFDRVNLKTGERVSEDDPRWKSTWP